MPALEELKAGLLGELVDSGVLQPGSPIEAALRIVPRHEFLPGTPLEAAWANHAVDIRTDPDGAVLSAASQPYLVAAMLDQLAPQQDEWIGEIGTATGYHAALLSQLVGPRGKVSSIEVDTDLAASARTALASTGYGANVEVMAGDGAAGFVPEGSLDGLVSTVGAFAIPRSWFTSLKPGGRAVVPLRIRGAVSRVAHFDWDGAVWRSRDSRGCTCMPLRDTPEDGGIYADPGRIIALRPDAAATLTVTQDQTIQPQRVAGVLEQPAAVAWSGVGLGAGESMADLWLWLGCTLPGALSRMPCRPEAIDAGVVRPQYAWGTLATVADDTLAYLTTRPAARPATDPAPEEIGVIGHGPHADQLADRFATQIGVWDRHYRGRPVEIAYDPAGEHLPHPRNGDLDEGSFSLKRPGGARVSISWH